MGLRKLVNPWPKADTPHRYRKSTYDNYCVCRASVNDRCHQPFWWRWFNPNSLYRR